MNEAARRSFEEMFGSTGGGLVEVKGGSPPTETAPEPEPEPEAPVVTRG